MTWLTLLLLILPQTSSEVPQYKRTGTDRLSLSIPSTCLNHAKVKKQLYSGLTATLAVELKARSTTGDTFSGLTRVDVRFEPWDEVFYLTHWLTDGSQTKLTLANFEALLQWFSNFNLTVISLKGLDTQQWQLETTLMVLPFSQSEREATKRWFAKTLSNQTDDKRDPNKVLDILVATSIKRKMVVSFFWKRDMLL